MNDQQLEQQLQDLGLTALRVTPADIEASITEEHYFTAAQGVEASYGGPAAMAYHFIDKGESASDHVSPSLSLLTFCVMILRNGHRIVGVNTGPVSADNFNEKIARNLARQHAIDQIWPLMGYALRERLAEPT